MKLWSKGYTTENIVEKFTVGNDRELDMKLAKYDVHGNIAHAKMLHKINILDEKELKDNKKNPHKIIRCWASINNPSGEMWKVANAIYEADIIIFFGS